MDVPESAVRVPFRPLSPAWFASNFQLGHACTSRYFAESSTVEIRHGRFNMIAPSHSFCVFRGFMWWAVVVGISYMALNPALTVFHFLSGLEDSRKWWTKSQDSVHKPQPFWRERRAEAVSNRAPFASVPASLSNAARPNRFTLVPEAAEGPPRVQIRFGSPFSSKVVVCGQFYVTVPRN